MGANSGSRRGHDNPIHKEIGSQVNRAFLARMPAFQAEAELPDEFTALLQELDRAETAANRDAGSKQHR